MDLAKRFRNIGHQTLWRKVLILIPLLLFPMLSTACPICGTETGTQVRQAIFGQNFLRNAARTLAPAPLLVGGIVAIYFGAPGKRSKTKDQP